MSTSKKGIDWEKLALSYHEDKRPGKIEVVPTKPCITQRDLSLAYTPGVAGPCRRIHEDPQEAFKYTARGNLVAVVTNGTAVLGLGDIGPLAGKPVMEGKGVLFKRFADVDVFDIELDTHDPDEIIKCCKLLEPTFGGINLEDIKAPECFYIEETLKREMNIPVFHDDQHGTAIISTAGVLNACEIKGKNPADMKVVISGAGAAGIACANMLLLIGVKVENVRMIDSRGVIYHGRDEMGKNKYKDKFAAQTEDRTLDDAMKGADLFLGVSFADLVSKDMVRSMNDDPIIFAMANPNPEIHYWDAKEVRDDLIMGTGRSDYPNQVNNVLGFPFIFRGALDVRTTAINDEMKLAASRALANLAKEEVPQEVITAYGGDPIQFGPDYVIPKPIDPRVLLWEAPAVAKAAMDTGVAQVQLDLDEYKHELEKKLGRKHEIMRFFISKAQATKKKRVVFAEGGHRTILSAVSQLINEGVCEPVLIGNRDRIFRRVEEMGLDNLNGIEIVDNYNPEESAKYLDMLVERRFRKGMTPGLARRVIRYKHYLASCMLAAGDVDAMIGGCGMPCSMGAKPVMEVIGLKEGYNRAAGFMIMALKDRLLIFGDTTMNIETTPEMLAEIAHLGHDAASYFDIEPRIAMVSFSNFGDNEHPQARKVARAVDIAREKYPFLTIDGEMHADVALMPEVAKETFPHSKIQGDANVLIFPELSSGNIAYKLVQRLAGAIAVGPVLMGLDKPANILNFHATVEEIVDMTSITVVQAKKAKADK